MKNKIKSISVGELQELLSNHQIGLVVKVEGCQHCYHDIKNIELQETEEGQRIILTIHE